MGEQAALFAPPSEQASLRCFCGAERALDGLDGPVNCPRCRRTLAIGRLVGSTLSLRSPVPDGAIETSLGWHFPDLRDFEFRLVVEGRPIVKKNHLTAIQIGKRRSIAPDSVYRAWEREAHRQLTEQWGAAFRAPIPKHIGINLAVITYLENRRGWPDLSGTYEGPADVLQAHRPKCDLTIMPKLKTTRCRQHAGVIANDSQIRGHVGSDIVLDRNNPPRVELLITPPIKTPPRDCKCQKPH